MSEQIHVGFTGSRHGTTMAQRELLVRMLEVLDPYVDVVHHGDCRGADEEFHMLTEAQGLFTVAHPPVDPSLRAFCQASEVRDPLPYLERNRRIVTASGQLWACPSGEEVRRSGTWSTIRFAVREGKPVAILWPDGKMEWRTP